jgi:hypothetical protein
MSMILVAQAFGLCHQYLVRNAHPTSDYPYFGNCSGRAQAELGRKDSVPQQELGNEGEGAQVENLCHLKKEMVGRAHPT